MATIRQLLDQQQLGLTVYSPDCTQSRLWGNLDHTIHEATGCEIVARQWFMHDINSIMRFYVEPGDPDPVEQDPVEGALKYERVPVEDLKYGHLVVRLFLQGPSLLTLWRGPDAAQALLTVKGGTHPPLAEAGTIRGGLWCDNGVCNLLHTSDNQEEAERELGAIRLSHLLDADASPLPLMNATPAPTTYAAHSGISVLCDVINRMLAPLGAQPLAVQLPASGNVQETHAHLSGLLRTAAERASDPIAALINAYLAGDLVAVTGMLAHAPLTKWEHFVIQCGAITRYKWNPAS